MASCSCISTATTSSRCLAARQPPSTLRCLVLTHQQRQGLRYLRAQQSDRSSSSEGAASTGSDGNPATSADASSSGSAAEESISSIAMPKIGYFSLADPKAEVYSRAGEVFDPKKKGGRYKSEFIWNTNWQEALQRQEDLERQQREYHKALAEGKAADEATGPGVVSFSRLAQLDDMSVDLTEQLLRKDRTDATHSTSSTSSSMADTQQRQASTARPLRKQTQQNPMLLPPSRPARQRAAAASPSYEYKDLPTRGEAKRFNRATKSAIRTAATTTLGSVGTLPPEEAAKRQRIKEQERARYEQLKLEFQLWTLALGVLGGVTAYSVYSKDVSVSYALGAAAGLLYLRLLGRSVDAVGDTSMSAAVSGAGAQPRLLIPVVLALSYNRWNVLYAASSGVTLQLLPMLVGFFTYKFAVLARQGLALLQEISEGSSGSGSSVTDDEAEQGGDDAGAMSLDRIFVKRALRE